MMKIHLIWFFSIQILLHVSSSSSGKVPALIVFGDSSVDSGNNNFIPTIARSNFEPYGRDFPNGNPTGRFSNGRLAPDFISEAFGLKPIVPAYLDHSYDITDFATGVCFASAGTGFDNITASVADVIPLWKEVEYYKEYQNRLRAKFGNKKANEIINESLYLISIGTNDFLENYYQRLERRLQFSVQEYEDFLIGLAENFLREIYDLGARKISMTGLIPMGCLPLERAINILGHHGCKDLYREICLGDGGYVVCYEMAEIENKLGLGRDSLIALSLLLGSDYHQGVHGLGPELACQIVKSIGEKDVLKKFASEGLGWVKKRKGAKNNIGKDDTILQVIDAYLKPKCHSADSDFVLKAHSQYPFQRTKLHHICAVYFEWPSERTDGYILPCIAERDLRRFANLRSTSSELGLNLPLHEIPVECPVSEIIKCRKVQGRECFEVSWKDMDGLETSIVPADLIESACPEKILEFEEKKLLRKKQNVQKRRPKKKETTPSLAELDLKLQSLLLDNNLEDNTDHNAGDASDSIERILEETTSMVDAVLNTEKSTLSHDDDDIENIEWTQNISNISSMTSNDSIGRVLEETTSMVDGVLNTEKSTLSHDDDIENIGWTQNISNISSMKSNESVSSTEKSVVIDLLSPSPFKPSNTSKFHPSSDQNIEVINLSDSENEVSPEHKQKAKELRLFLASIRSEIH